MPGNGRADPDKPVYLLALNNPTDFPVKFVLIFATLKDIGDDDGLLFMIGLLPQKIDGNASTDFHHVNIYLKDGHGLSALKKSMRNEQVLVTDRPARVNSLLKTQANASQNRLIVFASEISTHPHEFEIRARYHIVNMISAKVSTAVQLKDS